MMDYFYDIIDLFVRITSKIILLSKWLDMLTSDKGRYNDAWEGKFTLIRYHSGENPVEKPMKSSDLSIISMVI